mgnify:CR=1 FL=1
MLPLDLVAAPCDRQVELLRRLLGPTGANQQLGPDRRQPVPIGQLVVQPVEEGEAGLRAGPDDLLDAAAVAWTAARYVEGKASSYPDVPEVFSDGLPAAIWV